MKIYIASKTKHAPTWRLLREGLRGSNNWINSSWIDEAGEGQSADYKDLARRCLSEIASANFVILYCESDELLKGALIEAGVALAYGKEVRCVGDCGSLSRVFRKHPLWSEFATIEEALDPK